ncbi:uncharacterized protein TA13620 [Theileria annulata]|uniref:Uncharacterized protein n=1 Tax=Theileria annulata TaxID=5874 RepID=Q4UEM2_THEAN|nr:uncharacterized protein TA13620 [Theileria annulata]CAI74467.1 hypothetical protein TA13620 [Theileria annulata]|eukprot:XP_952199.1 hypothetical protein TA13620 [Theileria annulata]
MMGLEMEEFVINRKVNPIGEIGYPSSNFRQNIFEILVLEMLNNTDLNLCCTGIQLLSEVPTIASKSPQILNALFLFLIGPDDELSYLSALSLSKILPLLPEQVSLNFVKACYSNAIKSGHNVQRIKNFTLLILSSKQLKNISTYLYRMVWAVIISLDSHTKLSYQAKAILTEQKIALILSSTLVSIESQTNLKRHRERLEGLLHQNLNFLTLNPKSDVPNFENNRINLLFIRGLIYGLFLVYFSSEVDKPLIDKMADLTNITINNTLNPHKYVNIDKLTDGIDPLLNKKEYFFSFIYYGTCVKLLEFFVKTGNSSVFTQFLDCLKESLKYSSGNVNIIFVAKKCLKYLQNPCTILITLFTLIEQHISGLESVSRIKILLALLEIIEYSFLTDKENFAQFLSKYNETISNKSLKLIMRPLLQIQNVNYESILSEHDILVHHLYSAVNNETLSETFKTRPIVVDFFTGKSYVGDGNLTVVITKPKFSWGSEYSKILKKQIILNFIENEKRVECCDIYSNLYKVGNLCLRLGFYNEASSIFSRISFVSEDNYYWLRILYNFSNTCNINGVKKSEDLSSYFTKYISSVKNVLGLFKLMKTTNILKSQKQVTKCWDYNLNYHLPNSVLHTFVTLIVCTKLGIADLITCLKDKNCIYTH